MRRQNLRIFLLIAVLFTLAVLVLWNKDIDLPGDSLDRGGTGPLGLVLGLDLRGGAHLVYEAERPVKIDVTFEEAIPEAELKNALTDLDLGAAVVTAFDREEFSLDVPGIAQDGVDAFMQDLQTEIGTALEYFSEIEDRTRLNFTLVDAPGQDSVSQVFNVLGYSDVEVANVFGNIFTVNNLPTIDDDAENSMRGALEDLFPLDDLQIATQDDLTQAIVFFIPLPEEREFQFALNGLGYSNSRIVNVDGKNYTTTLPLLDEDDLAELESSLLESVIGLDEVSSEDIETALIDLSVEVTLDQSVVDTALIDLGFAQAAVTESRGRGYVVDLSVLDEGRDLTLQDEVVQELGAVSVFNLQREDATPERMEGVIDTIERRVNAFGITEPSVQMFGEDRVLIQLPGVEDTSIVLVFKGSVPQPTLENALEELGFEDALVDRPEAVAIPGLFEIRSPGLTQESQQEMRDGLEEQLGPLDSFTFDEAAETIQLSFEQVVAELDVTSTLNDLGFDTAVVFPGSGISYRVRVPTLSTPEQEELRKNLANAILPIQSFDSSGGVEEAKGLIGQTAQLIFKERTCLNADCSEFEDREAVGRGGEPLTGDNLVQAFGGTHPTTSLPIVNFVFDGYGTRVFRDFTTRIAGDRTKCIAHVLDSENIICPIVQQPIISGSGFIEGPTFTFDRVRTLAIQLESGSLPISLDLVRESTVDSFLGGESLRASLKAGIVGLALIVLFMILYYRAAGVVAALALMVYAAILLAVFKMAPVTLTLSGLAALILSIGMAVDANILIFERLKEELRTGRSLLSSMEIGFRRAWPAIRDSNTSTFITCGILFFFGRELGEPRITGFAITLAIGVAASMFTALTVSRNFLHLMAFTRLGEMLSLFSPEGARRRDGDATGDRQI